MAEIKRYECEMVDYDWCDMVEDPAGDYVAYEDYNKLQVRYDWDIAAMIEEKEYWRTLALQAAQQRGR